MQNSTKQGNPNPLNWRFWLRAAFGAATVLLAMLLAWQCLGLYLDGISPTNLDANGAQLQPAFTRGLVLQRLGQVAWYFWLWLGLGAMALLVGRAPAALPKATRLTAPPRRTLPRWVRPVLLAAALALVVIGVLNGGQRDVLVKATNLCAECVGLG